MIAFTKIALPFGWLGNMSRHPITYDDKLYPTAEHLFQCLRFHPVSYEVEMVRYCNNPMKAKWIAKSHKDKFVVEPLSEQDVNNMRMVIRLKIEQHPELKESLLNTTEDIVENCTNRRGGSGLFWGAALVGNEWIGKNVLGNLWVELRENLRK